jgi:hypothetical protein
MPTICKLDGTALRLALVHALVNEQRLHDLQADGRHGPSEVISSKIIESRGAYGAVVSKAPGVAALEYDAPASRASGRQPHDRQRGHRLASPIPHQSQAARVDHLPRLHRAYDAARCDEVNAGLRPRVTMCGGSGTAFVVPATV